MRTRRFPLVALFIASALLLPAPAWAEHDLTCHPTRSEISGLKWELDVVELFIPDGGMLSLHLRGTVKRDGTARATGNVNMDGQRLVAQAGKDVQATCADIDGDGVAGLSGLAAQFQTNRSREGIPVTIAPIGADIGQRGIYQLTVTIGQRTLTVQAEAAYGPTRDARRP